MLDQEHQQNGARTEPPTPGDIAAAIEQHARNVRFEAGHRAGMILTGFSELGGRKVFRAGMARSRRSAAALPVRKLCFGNSPTGCGRRLAREVGQ